MSAGIRPNSTTSHTAPGDKPTLINLLPESAWLSYTGRRRMRRWLSVLSLTTAMVGLVWLWSHNRGIELRQTRAALTEEQSDIRVERKQTIALAAQAEMLQKQRAILTAMRAEESWATRFAELSYAVPERLALKRIELSPAARANDRTTKTSREKATVPVDPGMEVQIEGYAANNLVLATFLHRLQESGSYQEVRLVRSAAARNDQSECLDFGIACRR